MSRWMAAMVMLWWMLTPGTAAAAGLHRAPVTFRSAGARLCATVTAPDRPRAAIVVIHGSGPDGGQDYAAQADMFALMGFATLTYDKRGWGCSGGDWHRRLVGLLAADAVAAGAAMRRRFGVPVGYWGISQGGWVLARVGATDRDAAFLIGVAAAGVSPAQQERWHKQRMAIAAGYPGWARRTADRYWTAALDLMIILADKPSLFPSLLEGERAASSFDLAYRADADWRRSSAPLLLLYGSKDELEPWFDSGTRIAAARPLGTVTRVFVFPGGSHAITTRTTGLAFDWGEAFDPSYAPTMRAFVDGAIDRTLTPAAPARRPAAWPGYPPLAAALALAGLTGLPPLLIANAAISRRRWSLILLAAGGAAWAVLILLLAGVIHGQGSFFDPAARFPGWGWSIPVIMAAAVAAAGGTILQALRLRRGRLDIAASTATIAFCLYWL